MSRLLNDGALVTILDDLSTGRPQNQRELISNQSFKFVEGSILNESEVNHLMKSSDFCFHLAAAVGVKRVIERPEDCIRRNLYGSEVVLSAASRFNCPILVTSTSEVYGKMLSESLKEDSDRLLGPTWNYRWVYSESKALEETLALRMMQTGELKVQIVRLFNTVGPGQLSTYGMVIPSFVQSAIKGDAITIYGNGSQVRAFCHVRDVIHGMISLASREDLMGEIFNLGSTEETTILQLAEKIRKIAKSSSRIEFLEYKDAYGEGFEEIPRRVANTDKIKSAIDWKAETSLIQIIEETISYWKKSEGR